MMKEMERLAANSFNSNFDPVDGVWGNFKSLLVEVSRNSVTEQFLVDKYVGVGGSFNGVLASALKDLNEQSNGDKALFFAKGTELFSSLKVAYEATKRMESMANRLDQLGLSSEFELKPSDQTRLLIQRAIIDRVKERYPERSHTLAPEGASEILLGQDLLNPVADNSWPWSSYILK